MWVAGVPENVDYKGSAYVFENLHVYNHKSLLKQGVDYTVKYAKNTNAGVATVTISGIGNYDKVITLRFNINKLPLGNLGVNDGNTIATDITLVANGKVQKGTTPVMYNLNGKYITLKKNKDYRFIYEDIYDYTAPDEYIVKIEGLGNYSGCGSFTEKIVSVGNMTPVSKLKFGKIADKSATGDPVYAEDLVIKDASRNVLIKDVDYTLEYINNVLPGTATVIVKGVELKGYSGTKVLSYKIKAIPISKAKISVMSACLYTKEECRPQFSVDYTPSKNAVTETLKEYVAGIGGDYSYEYVNNVKAGKNKAYIKVTGHGRFSGTLKKYFTITARDISDLECSNLQDEYEYVKGGVKPSFRIMDGDYALAAGKDYSVAYKNNKTVALSTSKKAPSVTIKGKGNYKGILLHTFDITVSSIDKGHIVVGDIVASNKAGTCKPVFTVYDKDNSKLKSGTDFEKTYELQYAQETYIHRETDSKRNISESVLVSDGDAVDVKKDIIPVGTDIRLIVTGKGKYVGTKKQVSTLSAEFTYVEADISKATVTVKEQDYIGQDIPVELSKGDIDITLKINGRIVRLDKDCYEIVKSTYVGNTKSGTAKVTIRGTRGTNYWCGGTKTISFKIMKRNLRNYFSN